MSVSPALELLCVNTNDVFLDVSKLLLTYADNILRYPNEEKYRSIRIGNPTFATKLLPTKGAVECLFEMGFEEAETHLVFPMSASVEQLKLLRDSIAAERDKRLQQGAPHQLRTPLVPSLEGSQSSTAASSQPVLPTQSNSFFVTLQSNFQHVMLYENEDLRRKARGVVPCQQLSSAAQHELKKFKEANQDCNFGLDDFLLLELLRWFKQDFFSWVDSLCCSSCGGSTENIGSLTPSTDDLRWGGQRVENHYCHGCKLSNRFPRYNNPEKLLETRRGRCGEWANCFTLCCRALGLEARYIWCSKDHVWTEVYSVAQKRWLHCDSCENACDKPLLYEIGWGKELDYVLAFSKDEVVDVTWRYSCKHQVILSRRTSVQETWLRQTISDLNAARQQVLSLDRKKQLTERLLVELVEFISPKKPKPGELGGRNSGSLAWRMARSETKVAHPGTKKCFVFTPTEKEVTDRILHVRYNSTKDQYCRQSNSSETVQGWDQCVWQKDSVFRKVENDWQMVYIAHTEESSTGQISWKFDLATVRMKIKSVSIMACSHTFHEGKVRWYLQSSNCPTEFSGDGKMQSFHHLSGSSEFLVVAELGGGGDDGASWQHSQLFRQSLKDTENTSFEVLVHFEDA
uniref:Peptide-N(4)-(N-acetyl-beta-glucosaminyl)asparagine amidase n=1 Tax=Cynoglossus semilaevis TaxID=244447 RepID=A0A3P8WDZ6_CYNSE